MPSLDENLTCLLHYAESCALLSPADRCWAANSLLALLGYDSYTPCPTEELPLPVILAALCENARQSGALTEEGAAAADRFAVSLLGVLTPRPAEVIRCFWQHYERAPEQATDWFYRMQTDCGYIRTDRMALDERWQADSPYGKLDLSINLSKPEKDPKEIAAARASTAGGYPSCLLCPENEGYAGRPGHPARQNLRLIPLTLQQAQWFLQYSPYAYYDEHCIVLSEAHRPMQMERSCFSRLLAFVQRFPHYFLGANADLPIVGGSILSHDHYQGGRYVFPMERAAIEKQVLLPRFPSIEAGILDWPVSVLRLRSADSSLLVDAAEQILTTWQTYSDPSVGILAETEGVPHNTLSAVARYKAGCFELDLALRCNITTAERPDGLFHPRPALHHIKKENIGLIEVMGLAILPARLQTELALLAEMLVTGRDPATDPRTVAHAAWAEDLRVQHPDLCRETIAAILQQETGAVFTQVLEDAGVFKRDTAGRAAFQRFLQAL